MNMIIPHLWFAKEAVEAAELYVSLFGDAKITSVNRIKNTPSGDCDLVGFQLAGQPFSAISAGSMFQLNPAISLMVHCDSVAEVDKLWATLSVNGKVMMPIGAYPFSERYGWVEDRYGVSWQLFFSGDATPKQKITPNFLFSKDVCGKAEEAIAFYQSVFPEAKVNQISRYGPDEAQRDAKINYASFELCGYSFTAMDNAYPATYTFNEAFSLMVMCANQEEVDYYWEKLSAVPEAEACGWLKDPYGVSWQIVPRRLGELMSSGTREQSQRVTQAFLKMKKFNIAALERAWE